jgi:hypothetical protein
VVLKAPHDTKAKPTTVHVSGSSKIADWSGDSKMKRHGGSRNGEKSSAKSEAYPSLWRRWGEHEGSLVCLVCLVYFVPRTKPTKQTKETSLTRSPPRAAKWFLTPVNFL